MALVVEDGSVVAGAEAYISVADADAYFLARGNAAWAALEAGAKEQALRKGCDYLDATFGDRFKGDRVSEAQALSWPRSGVYAHGFLLGSDTVPDAVARANAELAVRASAGDLLADAGAQVVQETVGPVSVTYAPGARQQTRYEGVERMLAALLRAGGMVAVARA